MDVMHDNKQWLFLGAGIVIVILIFRFIKKKLRDGKLSQERQQLLQTIKGRWLGSAKELHAKVGPLIDYEVSWLIDVDGEEITATSTARYTKEGQKKEEAFTLRGRPLNSRFFVLDYNNEDKGQINFGTEIIDVDVNGKSFEGCFVGFSSDRKCIVSGTIGGLKQN
jgi:hypothetical protein